MIVDLKIDLSMLDESFFDDIEEISEDTMIGIFVLHPQNESEIQRAKALCEEHTALFYTLPYALREEADAHCKGVTLSQTMTLLELDAVEMPLFIPSVLLDEPFTAALAATKAKGVILYAPKAYGLPNFYDGLTLSRVSTFSSETLEAVDMTRILFHSDYPHHPFESIETMAKMLSDALFRPEESIKNHATQNALRTLGLRQ